MHVEILKIIKYSPFYRQTFHTVSVHTHGQFTLAMKVKLQGIAPADVLLHEAFQQHSGISGFLE